MKGAKVKSDYTVLVNAMAQFNAAANKRKYVKTVLFPIHHLLQVRYYISTLSRFCQDHSLSLEKMTESKQSQGELLQALVGRSTMPMHTHKTFRVGKLRI